MIEMVPDTWWIAHSQEKVADMQRVTPAKAFPSAASIEEVLYQNASTDLEYAKPGNLGLRITRAISDIERRTGKVHGTALTTSH